MMTSCYPVNIDKLASFVFLKQKCHNLSPGSVTGLAGYDVEHT